MDSQHASVQRHLGQRSGKAGTALAVGVFLLSCLAMVPLLRYWGSQEDAADRTEYRFAEGTLDAGALDADQLQIKAWHAVDGFPDRLAQFNTVFWEPDDTSSLRAWLSESGELRAARVLEVGTGTGIIALWCSIQAAHRIVATDINPVAVANAEYNAMNLDLGERIDFRLAAQINGQIPGPYAVVSDSEKFDLVISNPPWEDGQVTQDAAFALYDTNFALLDGLLEETPSHLKPGGRLLLAYGARQAIQRILEMAPGLGWQVEILDSRELEELPEVFLPGMLLSLTRSQP